MHRQGACSFLDSKSGEKRRGSLAYHCLLLHRLCSNSVSTEGCCRDSGPGGAARLKPDLLLHASSAEVFGLSLGVDRVALTPFQSFSGSVKF